MRGIDRFCVTVSGTTNEEIWREIRTVIGGTDVDSIGAVELMYSDIDDYDAWVLDHWSVPFDKWLLWRLRIGTNNYGELPRNKVHDNKVGHCYAPCPYSTQSSDLRTRHMLKLADSDTLPVKVSHELSGVNYFMSTASKGPRWGYECSFPGCPHFILNGQKYFYT